MLEGGIIQNIKEQDLSNCYALHLQYLTQTAFQLSDQIWDGEIIKKKKS